MDKHSIYGQRARRKKSNTNNLKNQQNIWTRKMPWNNNILQKAIHNDRKITLRSKAICRRRQIRSICQQARQKHQKNKPKIPRNKRAI